MHNLYSLFNIQKLNLNRRNVKENIDFFKLL